MRTGRGGFLTVMAILLALTALQDIIKPFARTAPTPGSALVPRIQPGIVVLGVRHTGAEAAVLGPMVGAFLVFYAIGIWRIKRYAVTVGWIYAAYVVFNVTLFAIRNPLPSTRSEMIFAVVYSISAVVLTVGTAAALTRRGAHLS